MPKTICDICMEEYGDNDKSEKCPRILLCGHTFCTLCLNKIYSINNKIICPTCRAIDSRKINQITINRVIYDQIWEKKQINKNKFIHNNDINNNNNNNIINNINNINYNNNIINNNKSLNEDFEYIFKIALIGEQYAGKTSLSKCLIDGPLKKEDNYKPTIVLDFFTKIIECNTHLIKFKYGILQEQKSFNL